MKKINALARYFETNEWAIQQQTGYLIGITDFAQTVFGDIVFIELPKIGQSFQLGAAFAITESNKAANEICIPLSGEILEINQSLINNPKWLNEDPYGKGWLIRIKATTTTEWDSLMTAEQYRAYIGEFFNKT